MNKINILEESFPETDEWYTLPETIKSIKKYLKPNSTILCPFDKKESKFVEVLGKGTGHSVFHSCVNKIGYHGIAIGNQKYRSWSNIKNTATNEIWEAMNNNFFDYSIEHLKTLEIDYIISNPPFSKRNEIFKKLFELDKPFAMLVPLITITKKMIRDNIENLEILFFKKRQHFINYLGKKQDSPYDTVFLCYKILPKQIIMSDYEGVGE